MYVHAFDLSLLLRNAYHLISAMFVIDIGIAESEHAVVLCVQLMELISCGIVILTTRTWVVWEMDRRLRRATNILRFSVVHVEYLCGACCEITEK